MDEIGLNYPSIRERKQPRKILIEYLRVGEVKCEFVRDVKEYA